MRYVTATIAAVSLMSFSAPAWAGQAETATPASAAAPSVQRGDLLLSKDGKRIGRVESVRAANGVPSMVGVMFNGRVIYLPVSGLTGGDRGFVSSLTAAEIRKL